MIDKVYVHIWEGNANVYGNREACFDSLAESRTSVQQDVLVAALDEAEANPGEPAYLDAGMSMIRYLSIIY